MSSVGQMLKDLDLADGTDGKIRLAPGCKKRLLAELTADADFLAGLGLMDYSLLVRWLMGIAPWLIGGRGG